MFVIYRLWFVTYGLWPHRLHLARLFCPWNSPGKNTGVSSHSLLQGNFPTQGLNLGLLHCRHIPYCLSYQGGWGERQLANTNGYLNYWVNLELTMKEMGFPGGSVVRMCLSMQETQVRVLGQEDPPWRKKRQSIPIFLPWKSQRSLERLQSMGSPKSQTWLNN